MPMVSKVGAEIDYVSALASLDGDRDLLERLLGIFTQQSASLPQRLRSCLHAADYLQLMQSCHKLAGAAAVVGAVGLAQLAREIESALTSPDCDLGAVAGQVACLAQRLEDCLVQAQTGVPQS